MGDCDNDSTEFFNELMGAYLAIPLLVCHSLQIANDKSNFNGVLRVVSLSSSIFDFGGASNQ